MTRGYIDPATKASIFQRDLLGLPPVDGEKTAQSTLVFLGHGSADEKVPCSLGEDVAETMRSAGYGVQWKFFTKVTGIGTKSQMRLMI